MSTETLKPKFVKLRDQIRDEILAGVYRDGDALPPEETLAARHRVSRVTVRKALAALKDERIINSLRGSGTVVTLRHAGFSGPLDVAVLVAPVYDPFFSAFFHHFEQAADRNGTMVVFKQDPERSQVASADFYGRFLDRGIRDFVLWPGRGFEALELLPRLRGLRVNLVFFDHFIDTAYADCVQLDNRHAIGALVADLRAQGCRRLGYLGWDDVPLSSTSEREAAFRALARPADEVFHLSKHRRWEAQLDTLVEGRRRLPDGIVCINGAVGRRLCERAGASVHVAAVDEMPPVPGVTVSCVIQPLERMAEKAFWCLQEQNRLGARWKAGRYALKGTLKRLS